MRLVANAEKMVIAEARRAYTYLNLYDYGVDAVVVNRLLPESVNDPYFASWREAQERHMRRSRYRSRRYPILTARLFDREMYGLEALAALAEDVFEEAGPACGSFSGERRTTSSRTTSGYEVSLQPAAGGEGERGSLEEGRRVVSEGRGYRRNVLLPDSLARLTADGATVEGDRLKVRLRCLRAKSGGGGRCWGWLPTFWCPANAGQGPPDISERPDSRP